MGRQIKIFDTTLRDGEQSPGYSMNFGEKLEVARQLEKLNVDVIEAGFPVASPGDFKSVKAIAEEIKDCSVAALARAIEGDIDAAYESIKMSAAPRIHTFLATSPIHMQHKLKMSAERVVEQVKHMVAYAARLCPDVEFSAEDASRSDREFLVRVFAAAIRSGATVINIPDTVGYATPGEMAELVKFIKENTPGIEKAEISVHCHNDLGLAVANSLSSVLAGAAQVECTVGGIGERAGNAALEEIVMGINTRKAYYGADCRVNTRQIYRTGRLLRSITGVPVPPNKSIIGANAFAHEAGIHQHGVLADRSTYEIMTPEDIGIPKNKMVLGKHSGRHAFEAYLTETGHQLSEEALNEAFEQFKILADRKKEVTGRDIEAIVGNKTIEVPETYALSNYIINSGNTMTSTAVVRLKHEDEIIEKVAIGDGPIDAAFKAVNLAIEKELSLEDYSLRSVTEGEDALGEAVVKLSSDGETVTARGLSTDIIESSIKAYINGANKLLHKEMLK